MSLRAIRHFVLAVILSGCFEAFAATPSPSSQPKGTASPQPQGSSVGTLYEGTPTVCPQAEIDRLVARKLQQLGIKSAGICSDTVFIRRLYLDVLGTLPTPAEVRAFLENKSATKRKDLINQVLSRPEFADYWAMKWSDILRVKAEFPVNLWPNAAQAYHHWIRESLNKDKPYDQFVRELLTDNGSNFRVPQVNFYRAMQSRDPSGIAQTVALTFMGTRADKWPKEKLDGMAPFFSQISYKSTSEWKEEIVFYDATKLTGTTNFGLLPDGTKVKLTEGRDPRALFAAWLITPGNPWFTKSITNRVWSWLMGRGIIHEADDIRPDNPPSNPELLAYLQREFAGSKYDIKKLFRLILNSRTYQASSIPAADQKDGAEENFAVYPMRRLDAEVLIDAICQITGEPDHYSSQIPEPFTYVPTDLRSIALPDGSISSAFLELFGRASRDTGLEAERNNRPTAQQALHLLNSSHIQKKITQGPKLKAIFSSVRSPRDAQIELYLTILSRYPTDEELNAISAYSGARGREALMDLTWALINSHEFLYKH